MEQGTNQQQFNQPEQKSGGKMKNLIFVGVISSILGALIVGGTVYFTLNNSYLKKQDQLNNKISELQSQIDLLKKQNEKTQTPLAVEQDQTNNTDSVSSFTNNSAVTSCDFWKDRTYGKVYTDVEGSDAAGTLVIKGRIIQRVEDAAWEEGKKVTKVYLVFSDPVNTSQQVFYDRYLKMAQGGNSINRAEGQQLLFRIGIKENSEIITSADISNELKNRIMSFTDKADTIQLKLTIPIYGGRSVSDGFSFACLISE
jgi:outer membrane murein-binding lipoprotein Lpp